MKTILIATDFSKSSRHASLYGWQLGKAMNAKVIFLNVFQVYPPIAGLAVHNSRSNVRAETEKKLNDEANAITNGDSFTMETVCEEGEAEKVILSIAAEKNADIIIVGMQGKNKNLKQILGTTATSLIEQSVTPIIVVPEGAKYSAPKRVLYASDVTLDTAIKAIDEIKWVTDFFESKLHVVRVVEDGYKQLVEKTNTPYNLRKELKLLGTTFNFPVNTSVTDGLQEFIKKEPVDLVIMMARKHEWVELVFVKSETNVMICHTRLPLLILSEKPHELQDTGAFQALKNYSADNK